MIDNSLVGFEMEKEELSAEELAIERRLLEASVSSRFIIFMIELALCYILNRKMDIKWFLMTEYNVKYKLKLLLSQI